MRTRSLTLAALVFGVITALGLTAADEAATKKTAKSQEKAASNAARSQTKDPAADQADTQEQDTAVFAGGCFWCMEFAFEQVVGVLDVESGYCGGTKATANYDAVRLGTTGHAEAIRVTYDPKQVTYRQLLDVFFDAHDPTQLNRQGEDRGRQYRSAVFFVHEDQQKQVQAKIAELEKQGVHEDPIVTKVEPLKKFYPAEVYHQNFARRNPLVPYIRGHAVPNAAQVRKKHPNLIRSGE